MIYQDEFIGGPFDGAPPRSSKLGNKYLSLELLKRVDTEAAVFAIYKYDETITDGTTTTRKYRYVESLPYDEAHEVQDKYSSLHVG